MYTILYIDSHIKLGIYFNYLLHCCSINGKPWIPTKNSVICSGHFVGNRKSLHPRSPSYILTIFPKLYKKKLNDPLQQSARYE